MLSQAHFSTYIELGYTKSSFLGHSLAALVGDRENREGWWSNNTVLLLQDIYTDQALSS